MTDPIVKTVSVNCSVEHAFNVFVSRIGAWWPLGTHAVSAADGKSALDATIEPRKGGRVYETKHDGTTSDWGTVASYEPHAHFAMTWHPGRGPEKATFVEVTFEQHERYTLVTLTHSGWDIWGDEAADNIASYTAGWGSILGQLYVAACEEA